MKADIKQLILFDGVCNFCNKTVNFIIKKDKKDQFRFASLQSEIGQTFVSGLPSNTDSIVYVRNQKVLIKSTAALYIAIDLGYPFKMLAIFRLIPTSWRDSCYDYIAKNRYRWFGKTEQCEIPTEQNRKKFIS
jgi:predicted DCC family thiol-disulfide oxidoreductase YuxK